MDNGIPPSTSVNLANGTIRITRNINAPSFPQEIYNVTVNENTVANTFIFDINATDNDAVVSELDFTPES